MTMLKYSLSALILGVFSSHADEHSGNESPVLVNVLVAYTCQKYLGGLRLGLHWKSCHFHHQNLTF